ncbi:MAG TPA: hypothetical protein VGG05_10570 [Pseudonocardiaceae bacterium]
MLDRAHTLPARRAGGGPALGSGFGGQGVHLAEVMNLADAGRATSLFVLAPLPLVGPVAPIAVL